jgi:hypothetical protein
VAGGTRPIGACPQRAIPLVSPVVTRALEQMFDTVTTDPPVAGWSDETFAPDDPPPWDVGVAPARAP